MRTLERKPRILLRLALETHDLESLPSVRPDRGKSNKAKRFVNPCSRNIAPHLLKNTLILHILNPGPQELHTGTHAGSALQQGENRFPAGGQLAISRK